MHPINEVAKQYVKLSLQIGNHCPNFVDAYYGPSQWRETEYILSLAQIKTQLLQVIAQAKQIAVTVIAKQQRRYDLLMIQLKAAIVYIDMLEGQHLPFYQECEALYDAKPTRFDEAHFDQILTQLEDLVPGQGELNKRIDDYRQQFVIPKDKLMTVFEAAINESRHRTLRYIDMPEHENFTVELVNGKVWSAYNWYKGDSYSVIELNTDLPIQIERAIDLAAHEGYPGHHVFNALMEKHLVDGQGWLEYSIYNLFSPISLLAEGSANYGIEVAFPWSERLTFEKEVLFPLAQLDPSQCEQYYQIARELQRLSYSDNMIAQRYLDGEANDQQAIELLMKYALNSEQRAIQRLKFIKQNRAYVITYNYGQDLVKQYLQNITNDKSGNELWRVFETLLSQPKTASMMLA